MVHMKNLLLTLMLTLIGVPQLAWGQVSPSEAGAKPSVVIQAPKPLAPQATAKFYSQQTEKRIWTEPANFQALIQALEGLDAHGLSSAHYHLTALKSLPEGDDRDRLATDAWFSAAAHMLYGKLNPISLEPDWTAARREADLPLALTKALSENSILESLEAFAPKQASYTALKAELAALKLEAQKPQTRIALGEALKASMQNDRVSSLQARLIELGYLPDAAQNGIMDEQTVDAVKAFQRASELDDDGVAGPATVKALNRGYTDKINQLRLNMERWRWLPEDLGKRHLRANIAAFTVEAWNNGSIERTHLTIVGKPYRKTPVFSDSVEYLVINPWWETPHSLATRDKLPLFRKDPAAVKRLGFQILDRSGNIVSSDTIDWNAVSPSQFPYRIRQAPGDQNALGQVKIMFPNIHNVYLHDTPTRGLFSQRQRAFSSGCLRTENPLDLAAWLMSGTEWTREKIDNVVANGKETRITLPQTVPVHILYFTAVSEGDAGIRYLDDIYDRDAKVLAALDSKPS